MRKAILLASVGAAFLMAGSAVAGIGTPAVTIDEVVSEFNGSQWNLGWEFTLDAPMRVSGLGMYDSGGDGLGVTHDVAIWRVSDQAMVVSGTVQRDDALIGLFRYTEVDGPVLEAGVNYIVAATSDGRDMESQNNIVTYAAGVNYVGARWAATGDLAFPENTADRTSGYHGGTFALEEIPAPGALALMGMAGLVGRRRRR